MQKATFLLHFNFVRNLNSKLLQTIQNTLNLVDMKVKIKSHKKWQTSAIVQDISDYNLYNGTYGPKSGVSFSTRREMQELS